MECFAPGKRGPIHDDSPANHGMLKPMRHALVLFFVMAASLFGADLTGTWTADVQTDAGSGTPTFEIKQDGDKLSGVYRGQLGEEKISGQVKGNHVTWTFKLSQGTESMEVKYEGEVQSDGTMKGKVALGTMASGTWTAKKK